MFGVAVAENAGDALPCPPAARMPRTLVAFKEALREKAADDCFPFGAQAKTVSVVRQVALVELSERDGDTDKRSDVDTERRGDGESERSKDEDTVRH